MSAELADKHPRENELFVRFCCESPEHPKPIEISVPANGPIDANLEWFISQHVHDGANSARLEKDRGELCKVLGKFFTEHLPSISEIMERRKWTFGFEVKPKP